MKLILPKLPTLDRYLLGQLIPAFLLSIGLFSSLGVAVGTFSDLANKIFEENLSLRLAIEVFLLKVPEFMAYSFPISILLSAMMVYGKLSKDSEIIALLSCGVGIIRIIAPAIVFSLIVALFTLIFNELIVPSANYKAKEIMENNIKMEHKFAIKKDIIYPDYEQTETEGNQIKSLFYAEYFNKNAMNKLTVLVWDKKEIKEIIVSQSARWNEEKNSWNFFDGEVYRLKSDRSYGETIKFDRQEFKLPKTPLDLVLKSREPEEMNIAQIKEYLAIIRMTGDEKKNLLLEVRLQQKMAFPFICVVFGLVGSTLGISPQQVGRAKSFGMSVAIVFCYYLLAFIFGGFSIAGIIPPWMAGWLPIFCGMAVGGRLLFLSRAVRRASIQ
jgi:lipopolysaccharide export system permease protein